MPPRKHSADATGASKQLASSIQSTGDPQLFSDDQDDQSSLPVRSGVATDVINTDAQSEQLPTTEAAAAEDKPKGKRRQKAEEKKVMQKAAADARKGVTIFPLKQRNAKENNDGEAVDYHGHDEDCRCMFCECKFCADPTGKARCGDSLDERCVICRNINRLLHNQMMKMNTAHNAQIEDLLQGKDDLDKGLIEERRKELVKERFQRGQRERTKILIAQLEEIISEVEAAKGRNTIVQDELATEENKRKEQDKKDIAEILGNAKFALKFTK